MLRDFCMSYQRQGCQVRFISFYEVCVPIIYGKALMMIRLSHMAFVNS